MNILGVFQYQAWLQYWKWWIISIAKLFNHKKYWFKNKKLQSKPSVCFRFFVWYCKKLSTFLEVLAEALSGSHFTLLTLTAGHFGKTSKTYFWKFVDKSNFSPEDFKVNRFYVQFHTFCTKAHQILNGIQTQLFLN